MIDAVIRIPEEVLAAAIARQIKPDRQEAMVRMHGEAIKRNQAAKLLNVTPRTVCDMVKDGRLRETSDGMLIDVRSMADYIENKGEADRAARVSKRRKKLGLPEVRLHA